ncbi:D-erythronate dehydrogenase [Rubellimicrobium roseum]|uniref:SDR family oxidoreductase n=1 Tax=Rubellimicrobium roseum TaxID=687525 RepID=A0A5C4NLG2_9RHOB|nr:D-erythronate dehydrogenase [Rubellimicrobium roseum]TNC74830.1 SDR family oxidoreductase [Rubellimicrobium roseum]
MRILVTGAAGMIGRKLVQRLLEDEALGGRALEALVLHDVVRPEADSPMVTALEGDLSAPGAAEALVAHRPDVIVHLAGVVSGEAEADFDKGYRVNLDGTRALLDAVRQAGLHPRVVFASSEAVFGGPFPDVIPDDFAPVPLTSYGGQKLMGEILVNDLSRRGMIDGVSIRFPTICVRPGKPNRAASGFFSGIIREPLVGLPAVLPVPRGVVHTMASPRAAVGFVLHAATMDTGPLGGRRAVIPPGVAVSVGEEIEALRRVGGERAVALIEERPDPAVWAIVQTWAKAFEARRGRELGFVAEDSFDEILRVHIEDELGGRVPVAEG